MSGSSSPSLSHGARFFFLPFFFGFGTGSGAGVIEQTLHAGTRWFMMSSSIAFPGTVSLQFMQLAVANEPWHCKTFCTPARVSSVSMFCV